VNLEIPERVILADGTTAQVKAVKAAVIDGGLGEVVFTIEKHNGAWADVTGEELRPAAGSAAAAVELLDESSAVLGHGTLRAEDAVANASMVSEGGHVDAPKHQVHGASASSPSPGARTTVDPVFADAQ
jgi:hypothetical protein